MIFSSYLSTVLGVGICAFLCENIASVSTRKGKSLERAVSFITSLCLFCGVTLPIIKALSTKGIWHINENFVNESESAQESLENTFYGLIKEELEKSVTDEIIKKFGIEQEKVSIQLSEGDGEIIIDKVNVAVNEKDFDKANEIENFIRTLIDGDFEITVTEKHQNE